MLFFFQEEGKGNVMNTSVVQILKVQKRKKKESTNKF